MSATLAKCPCNNCSVNLEYEIEYAGDTIQCPICGLDTLLFVQSFQAVPASVPRTPTPRKVESKGDEIELLGDTIIIRRRGLANMLAAGLNGDRSIAIPSLTGIQLNLGSWWCPGYILFSYAGSRPFMGGIFDATEDPDAFIFGQEKNEEIEAFKQEVESILRASRKPAANHSSLAAELSRMAELRQQGLLSDQEFDSAKKKLLAP